MNVQSDQAILERIQANGVALADLFLVAGAVFRSPDAGDFRATSEYARYNTPSPEDARALVSLLRRQAAPEYETLDQLEDEIAILREWESLYEELAAILDKHGKQDPFGDGDYFLVDDCYSTPQHKVECTSKKAFTPALVADVQTALLRYQRKWEVIFALPSEGAQDHAFTISASACVASDA